MNTKLDSIHVYKSFTKTYVFIAIINSTERNFFFQKLSTKLEKKENIIVLENILFFLKKRTQESRLFA